MKSGIRQNLILITVTVISMVLAFVLGINLAMPSVVALEQDARCGMVEHVHRDECYLNNVLICGEKAHTHGENCYLLRLEDNDINRILSEIEADEEKSLEHVITNVVYKASYLELVKEGVLPAPTPTPTPTPTPLIELLPEGSSLETLTATNASVAALNDSIEENNITPALYLNERLISPASEGGTVSDSENIVNLTQGQNSPTDLVTYAAGGNSTGSGGISTLAVNDSAVTTGNVVNFYIWVDETELICIGTVSNLTFYDSWLGSDYYYAAESDIVALYNTDEIISTITTSSISSSHYVRYATTIPTKLGSFNNSTSSANYNNAVNFGATTSTKYAIFSTNRTNINNNSVVNFYTVKIQYSDGTATKTQYVQSGQDSTLPIDTATYEYSKDNFTTIIADNQVASQRNDINSATTLYARPKGYTVTFNSNGGNYTPETQTLSKNGTEKAKKPEDPTKEGHTFTGWFTDNGDFKNEYTFTEAVDSNITLYAKWTANTYTVIYDGNGATAGTMENSTHTYNSEKNLSANTYSKTGYTFTGWNTMANGGDVAYTDGQSVKNLSSDNGAKVTLYAQWAINKYTVTFNSNGGSAVAPQTIDHGGTVSKPADPTWVGGTFTGWYTDAACTKPYDFSKEVTGNIALYAGWDRYTYSIEYYNESDVVIFRTTKRYGDTYVVDYALPAGCTAWVDMDDPSASYDPDEAKTITVTRNYRFRAASNFIVTYVDRNGNSATTQVTPGYTLAIKAPTAGYVWVDEDGNQYSKDDSLVVTRNVTLTEKPYLTITYNVDFTTPSGLALDEAAPTLAGDASQIVAEGNSAAILDVSDRTISVYFTSHSNIHGAIQFMGWAVNGDENQLISPAAKPTWDMLSTYANGSTTITLTGVWDYHPLHFVNFYVKYNAADISNSTELGAGHWTSVVFETYLGGVDTSLGGYALGTKYNMIYDEGDYEGKTYYEMDLLIRAMYGERDDGLWFATFPNDADVLATIKAEVEAKNSDSNASNDIVLKAFLPESTATETVDISRLDTEHYEIRWSTFKTQGEGFNSVYTWHVDGALVKKEGVITVDKEFYGDADAIAKAKNGFYIMAQNGTVDAEGNFTPYNYNAGPGDVDVDDNGVNDYFLQYVLTLDQDTANSLKSRYPYANFIVYGDTTPDQYEWRITKVTLGEHWRITEHPPNVDGHVYYAEYSVYDTDGVVTSIAEYGTQAAVIGKTFALDEDPDQGMLVDFRNYYYSSDSLFIKKEDGNTGVPIGGAAFQLWQYNSNNELAILKFSIDANGNYKFDSDGTETTIYTGSLGYTTVSIEDFSYEHGDVVIKEVSAPAGYDKAPSVQISNNKDKNTEPYIKDVFYEGGGAEIGSSEFGKYAEVHDSGNTVVIKDYSTLETSLNVTKKWDGDTTADRVIVVLMANNQAASTVFPGMTGVIQTLSDSNNWTYEWTKLPVYANGEVVEWSVRETVIGDESVLTDGVTFANWIASYSAPVRTDSNGDGITDNWSYTVTNTVRRTMIILTKVDGDGAALPGAGFTLTEVVHSGSSWTTAAGGITINAVSDSNGVITFDNLTAGKYYKLSETSTPEYFWPLDDVVVTVDGTGIVKLAEISAGTVVTSDLNGDYHTYTNPYNIRVKNISAKPLPETGGMGTHIYTAGGLLLMAAAVALLIYRRKRRKEADLLDV